jgi:hypothetical protein
VTSETLLQEIAAGEGEYLTRAARRIPSLRQGKPATLSCLLRWVLDGVRGPEGTRVKLEAARLAGKWVTTPGAVRRFVLAQTPADSAGEVPKRRTEAQALRAAEKAGERLKAMGV